MSARLRTTLPLLTVLIVARTCGKEHFDKGALDSLYRSLETPTTHVIPAHESSRGVFRSCGPPNSNFSIAWEPEILHPEGNLTIYFDFKTPYDIERAILSVSVSYASSALIFEDTEQVDCNDLKKFIPCPMKAGTHFKRVYTEQNLLKLQGFQDTYDVKGKLTTFDGKVIICAKATVTIRS